MPQIDVDATLAALWPQVRAASVLEHEARVAMMAAHDAVAVAEAKARVAAQAHIAARAASAEISRRFYDAIGASTGEAAQ